MKKFEVRIELPTYYTFNVVARDEVDARSKAWDLYETGDPPHDFSDPEIVEVRECA